MKKRIGWVVIALSAGLVWAGEGIVAQVEIVRDGQAEQGQMIIMGNQMSMDMVEKGTKAKVIYHGDQQSLLMVDHDKQQCITMNKASMDGMRQAMETMMSQALQQMEAQFKNMPPEQRAKMEEMMKKNMGGMGALNNAPAKEPPEVRVEKTGEKAKIEGHSCQKYNVFVGGEKSTELWVTDWKNVPVTKQDFKVIENMGKTIQDMMGSMPGAELKVANPFAGWAQVNGFPIKIIDMDEGQAGEVIIIKSMARKSVEASAFEVPEGYQMIDPAKMMGGR